MKTAMTLVVSCLILPVSPPRHSPSPRPRPRPRPRARPRIREPRAGAGRHVGTNASTSTDYRLAAGDKLRIEVYKDAQLSQALQIRPDGKVTLPLVGDVVAAGRTSVELREAITESLKEYIGNPVVTVIVTETAPQLIYLVGEVNKPGAVPLTNGRISIIQALALAGGFTDFANKKDIRVQRKTASGMQTLHFNYKDALDDESRREPLTLLPGDTVIVK
jgi:polysaccharide export outer membrane protein